MTREPEQCRTSQGCPRVGGRASQCGCPIQAHPHPDERMDEVGKLAEMKKEILDYYKKQLFRASRNLERARTEAERKSLKIKVNAYRWALSMAADKWKEDEDG